jgi:mevalonate kinase
MSWQASACGKIILLGEHAVVYGQPAIAIPIPTLRATAGLKPGGASCILAAPDIEIHSPLESLPADQPLVFCIRLVCDYLKILPPIGTIYIHSSLPVASGLGSGAAVSTAIVRLMAAVADRALSPREVSGIVFQVEQLYHGTPSGVDNTVIAWEQPIWYISGEEPSPFSIAQPVRFLIADSGIPGKTKIAVGGVRQGWQANPDQFQLLFENIGRLTALGRQALETGNMTMLGDAMNEDHQYLKEIGVSLPELDSLVLAAQSTGAWGAKLSGGGLGGHIIALVDPSKEAGIQKALQAAGAKTVFATTLDAA